MQYQWSEDIQRFLKASPRSPVSKPQDANRGDSYPPLTRDMFNQAVQDHLSRFSNLTGVKKRKDNPTKASSEHGSAGEKMRTYLHIGGLVAVGFDPTGAYLLTITHSGRGVFSTRTWERVARDTELAYPEAGAGVGIGPIDGQLITITEMDFSVGEIRVVSPDGRIVLECESSGIAVVAGEV